MAEHTLPRWHQFFQLTKTKNRAHERGNISILSLWWVCITLAGCVSIVAATSVVQQRAMLQWNADAIALAYVTRGSADAYLLARAMGVTLTRVEKSHTDSPWFTVYVSSSVGSASAEASPRGW